MVSDEWCLIAVENQIADLKQKAKEGGKCVRCGKPSTHLYCCSNCKYAFRHTVHRAKEPFDAESKRKMDNKRFLSRKYQRERVAEAKNDPEKMEKIRAKRKVSLQKHKEKIKHDPVYQEKCRVYARRYYLRSNAARQAAKANRFMENASEND